VREVQRNSNQREQENVLHVGGSNQEKRRLGGGNPIPVATTALRDRFLDKQQEEGEGVLQPHGFKAACCEWVAH
jgi:hypothetical protein